MSENININRQQHNITISEPMRDYHLPIASETVLGGIKVGNNLTITSDGTLSAETTEYNLPTASASTLGGIKVGNNLTISSGGVLTSNVDTTLSGSSTNPVQNSTITSNINSINNTLGEYDTRIDNLEDNYSTLSSTVSTNTSDISDNTLAISNLSTEVSGYSDAISTNTSNIAANALAIEGLDGRLDDAESSITDQGNAINEMGGQINALILSSDDEIEYSYLLPANVWSGGSITVCRRGNIAILQFDLTGTYDLQSEVNSQIYQLPNTLQNTVPCTGTLITNDGCIEVKVDASRNIKFYNHDSQTKHIIEIKGQLTIVL